MRTVLFVSIGALAALCPASAAAQAEQPASSVSITAPSQVAYGKHFTVRVKVTLPGPDDAYITGGFMDFGKTDPVPSKSKCPATPAGTFAADTPQSPQPAGLVSSTIRSRNSVKRTGTLRFCIWVIDAATGEQSASGAAYVKALAKKKRTRTHASARRVRAAAVRPAFKGQTSQLRHPIRLRIVSGAIRDLTYSADFRCSDGLTVAWTTRLASFPLTRSGTFKAKPPPFGTQNDTITIQGRVKGRHVTGSFSETYTSVLGNTCRSGRVRF